MRNILVVVDVQNDFVDGSLGTKEARSIIPAVVKKINETDAQIFVTLDTHPENYLDTSEGGKLPVKHCIKGTAGHDINKEVASALENKNYIAVEKRTFGSFELPSVIASDSGDGNGLCVELVGLCTDICVVSNALILKAAFPEAVIKVDSSCCAGTTPQAHSAALSVMKSCQIDVE